MKAFLRVWARAFTYEIDPAALTGLKSTFVGRYPGGNHDITNFHRK